MALKTWQIILIALGAMVGLFFLASIAIGAIAYFGVLSPSKMLPQICSFPAELSCVERAVVTASDTAGTIEFWMRNNVGDSITVINTGYSVSGDCTASAMKFGDAGDKDSMLLNNGERFKVTVTCSGIDPGSHMNTITFSFESSLTGAIFPVTGKIRGNAQ